jgi:hypothetical protein
MSESTTVNRGVVWLGTLLFGAAVVGATVGGWLNHVRGLIGATWAELHDEPAWAVETWAGRESRWLIVGAWVGVFVLLPFVLLALAAAFVVWLLRRLFARALTAAR